MQRLLRRYWTGQTLAQRLLFILACAEPGATNLGVATALEGQPPNGGALAPSLRCQPAREVGRCAPVRCPSPRRRRGGERFIALTLEEAPRQVTHWSTCSMAHRSGMSQSAISRMWRTFSLRAHRTDVFKPSSDPVFIEKVRDVVHEKPHIQAVQGTASA